MYLFIYYDLFMYVFIYVFIDAININHSQLWVVYGIVLATLT